MPRKGKSPTRKPFKQQEQQQQEIRVRIDRKDTMVIAYKEDPYRPSSRFLRSLWFAFLVFLCLPPHTLGLFVVTMVFFGRDVAMVLWTTVSFFYWFGLFRGLLSF
jgi:hypothetical protein